MNNRRLFVILLLCETMIVPARVRGQWDMVVKYDGGLNPVIKKPTGTSTVAIFSRNKPTVDDDGAPLLGNMRRFAKEPVGIAGHVEWQDAGIELDDGAALLGSGPGGEDIVGFPLVVVRDGNLLKMFSVDVVTLDVSVETTTNVTMLDGTTGTTSYVPRAACVWYGLIVMYAERLENGVPVGITLFYSQDRGDTWDRVPTEVMTPQGPELVYDVPPNEEAEGEDEGLHRGRQWAGPKPFPAGGVGANPNDFAKDEVYFPWTDYLRKPSGSSTMPFPRGYQAGLFRATYSEMTGQWTVDKNRVIAERWEADMLPANGGQHGHTAHPVSGGMVVWYGDSAAQNGADYIAFDVEDYEDATLPAPEIWHGGIETELRPGASVIHARNCLQPGSACPAPGGGVLMAGDTFLEPVVHLADAATKNVDPVLTPRVYMLGDLKRNLAYSGWATAWMQWYPEVGWISGGVDDTLYQLYGQNNAYEEIDPVRHISYDGETFAALPNSAVPRSFACLAGSTIVAMGAPAGGTRPLLIAQAPIVKKLRPLRVNEGANNLLGAIEVGSPTTPTLNPATSNTTRVAEWDSANSKFKFKYPTTPPGPEWVPGAPTTRPPLNNPKYVVLTTGSLVSEQHGTWHLQGLGGEVYVNSTLHVPVYMATCTPQLSADLVVSAGIGGDTWNSARLQRYKPGCNQNWFACPHFGIGTPSGSNPVPTMPGRGRINLLGGAGGLRPNRGNVIVAIGGLYNTDLAVWPDDPSDETANPDEREIISGFPQSTAWTLAVTVLRPNMSQTLPHAEGGKTVSGTLFRVNGGQDHYIEAYWNASSNTLEIYSFNGAMDNTLALPCPPWFRTEPLHVVISDDGTDLEATVMLPGGDLVTDAEESATMGAPPQNVQFYLGDTTYNLEVAAVGYSDEFMDEDERKEG